MEALTETLRIRVTKADKAAFEQRAKSFEMSLSEWARDVLSTSVRAWAETCEEDMRILQRFRDDIKREILESRYKFPDKPTT